MPAFLNNPIENQVKSLELRLALLVSRKNLVMPQEIISVFKKELPNRAVARTFFSEFFLMGFLVGFSSSAGWSGLGQQSKWVRPGPTHGSTKFYRPGNGPGKKSGQTHFFLQTLKNSLNFLIIFFFQQ